MYILSRSIGDPEFTFGRVLASEIASTTTSVSLFLILFHLCPLEAASSTLSVRQHLLLEDSVFSMSVQNAFWIPDFYL